MTRKLSKGGQRNGGVEDVVTVRDRFQISQKMSPVENISIATLTQKNLQTPANIDAFDRARVFSDCFECHASTTCQTDPNNSTAACICGCVFVVRLSARRVFCDLAAGSLGAKMFLWFGIGGHVDFGVASSR